MERNSCLRAATIWLPILLLCALSGCGGGGHRALVTSPGAQNYPAPGPPGDPWGPYIRQASARFDVPELWVRAVIRQESGGRQYLHGRPITSDAGAMGLMQLMPATYGELAARYGLGPDPYDPHDNILAGTGYIGELYARYGSPAFLAAYDAGPHRLESYLNGGGTLPNETVNYLASAAPNLGADRPMTGPLAAFADPAGAPAATSAPAPRLAYNTKPSRPRCRQDPNAAYDPDTSCRSAPPAWASLPPPQVEVAQASLPNAPLPRPMAWGQGAPVREPPPPVRHYASTFLIPSAAAATVQPAMATGRWAIQVGAFSNPDLARRTAENVRGLSPRELGGTRTVLGTTDPFGGQILYRARLLGLSAGTASAACTNLKAHAQPCVTVPPGA